MSDDLRTLAQAVVDAWRDYGETASLESQKPALEAAWKAAMRAARMDVRQARAILAALDAADAQGYARAMGEVVEHLNSLSDAAVATYQEHRTDYADGFADGSVEAWQAVRKLAERD